MSTKIERLEPNIVKLTFNVELDKFEKGVDYAYNRIKNDVKIEGFRKGKVPKQMIIAQYGKEVFYEEALNFFMPELFENAIKEHSLDPVSQPYTKVVDVNDEGAVVEVQIFVKPEVTVENYKGVEVKVEDPEVTEEEIENFLNQEREKSARIIDASDRAVQNGDIVSIDFEGFVDGVAFEGGKGEDYDLTIGSGTFIDTFEEQLVGLNVNDEKTVEVTFPENYGQADLAGKPAQFKCKVNDIKTRELPELNDEFAGDVSEFDTLDEFKADIKKNLTNRKTQELSYKKENDIMEALIEATEITVPLIMVENQINSQIRAFEAQLKQQGMELGQYLQFLGQDEKQLRDMYREQSEKQVRGRLILEAIAKAEGFEVNDSDVDAEIEKISSAYGMPVEELKSVMRPEDVDGLKQDIATQKALGFVVENAKEVK